MLTKIEESEMYGNGPIRVLYPGVKTNKRDTGIGSIGRIDHAFFRGNHLIKMYPHVNDEILSYFRSGKTEHKDSQGNVEWIGKNRLMLMKAGQLFYHEERMIDEGEPMEGLQIFIRPGSKDLTPEVLFWDLDTFHSVNAWRLIASPHSMTYFQFSSQTWIYDILLQNSSIQLPEQVSADLTCVLYVFNGQAMVNNELLEKRESIIIRNEKVIINSPTTAEIVLFVTDEKAEIFDGGMFSGNQM